MKAVDGKKVGEHTRLSCVHSCSTHGVIAWMVYAIVEFCFTGILPWFSEPAYAYKPLHAGFTVILFLLYLVIGLILGGFLGFFVRTLAERYEYVRNAHSPTLFAAVGTTTLVSVFAINLVLTSNFVFPVALIVLVCILLILSMVASIGPGLWSRRIRFIADPWTCCILLVGLSAILMEIPLAKDSKVLTAGVVFSCVFAVLLCSLVVKKPIGASVGSYHSARRSLAFLVSTMLVLVGIGFVLKQSPLRDVSHLKPAPLKSNNPNVILISMDTVRADHLSLYGYGRDTTPNLKKFAEEAALYTKAISSSPFTLPTHASIFTGLPARSHGAHYGNSSRGQKLNEDFHTLAEILSEKGCAVSPLRRRTSYD